MRVSWGYLIAGAAAVVLLLVLWVQYAMQLPGKQHTGPLPAATIEEDDLARRLNTHVVAIASTPHNVKHYAALEAAARYIEGVLQGSGYTVRPQIFTADGRSVRNVEVVREPKTAAAKPPTLVIGAHYDSYDIAPGANDNGTGTAGVLELARLLKDWTPREVRLRFVLFVNEEPPYYRTDDMGSLRYARMLYEQGEDVRGMINLETIGSFSDKPGSQEYFWPLNGVLPDKADFIAVVGLTRSRAFQHEVVASFRKHTAFPLVGITGSDLLVPGIGWSDHWSFRRYGYPAIMLTDTAPFRYPYYHTPEDTPEKISYGMLARIVKGVERVIRELAP